MEACVDFEDNGRQVVAELSLHSSSPARVTITCQG
jgi:hypothetical protein